MKFYRNIYNSDLYKLRLKLDNNNLIYIMSNNDVLKCCSNTGSTSTITIDGYTFQKQQVKSVEFGSLWDLDHTPVYFCRDFNKMEYIGRFPDQIRTIGGYSLSACYLLSQPIILHEYIISIETAFMYQCNNFIGPLEILFTDPNVFTLNDKLTLSAVSPITGKPIYQIGVTITGNMAGAQLRTRLGDPGVYYRNILD